MRNAEAIRSICQVYSALVPGYFDEVWMWVITAARSGRLDRLGDGDFVHAIGRHLEGDGADPLASASTRSSDTSAITTLAPTWT